MPRLHSSVWFGGGMIAASLLLIIFVIPHWVIKPENVRILVLSPDFWPYIVAGLMGVGGIALLSQYWFMLRHMPVEEEVDRPQMGGLRTVLVAVLMVIYYVLMQYFGMVWTSVIAYVAFALIVGIPRKTATMIVAIILPIALYAFFAYAAGVPIPQADFLALP